MDKTTHSSDAEADIQAALPEALAPPSAPNAGRFSRRTVWLLLAGCGLLTVMLWLLQVNPYLNPADDAGRYMVLGESLAKNGDLRLINDARQLRDTLYVPGFPAVIALWMKITGRDPGGVVVSVKGTLLLFLLGSLPLFYGLLRRARLRPEFIAAGLVLYAVCPALIAYANEIMSELPLLFLCLAAIVLVEAPLPAGRRRGTEPVSGADPAWPDSRSPAHDTRPESSASPRAMETLPRLAALAVAALSYYVRAAGVVLLLSLLVWYWKAFGRKWGALVLFVMLCAVGSWQLRNRTIIAQDPPNTHDTYVRQFTLRDPDNPSAGRIEFSARKPIQTIIGLLGRVRRNFPAYVGNISRSVLYIMGPPNSIWLIVFYLAAIPLTLLALLGAVVAWKRGLRLTCGFCGLFWLFVAFWPWRSARFLVPLIPFIMLFALLGTEEVFLWARKQWGTRYAMLIPGAMALALLVHFARVYTVIVPREHAPVLTGYSLGRTRDEGGFYMACAWLKSQEPDAVAMGRPAYLLHLYSGHPTTQIEPSTSPRVQEIAYMEKNKVAYLVVDAWPWSHTLRYLGPYLREYGASWTLAWQDPNGSGVRVYKRKEAYHPEAVLRF